MREEDSSNVEDAVIPWTWGGWSAAAAVDGADTDEPDYIDYSEYEVDIYNSQVSSMTKTVRSPTRPDSVHYKHLLSHLRDFDQTSLDNGPPP